jgi:hypothetical protein
VALLGSTAIRARNLTDREYREYRVTVGYQW